MSRISVFGILFLYEGFIEFIREGSCWIGCRIYLRWIDIKLVTSLVSDVVNPLIGLLLGLQKDFSRLHLK